MSAVPSSNNNISSGTSAINNDSNRELYIQNQQPGRIANCIDFLNIDDMGKAKRSTFSDQSLANDADVILREIAQLLSGQSVDIVYGSLKNPIPGHQGSFRAAPQRIQNMSPKAQQKLADLRCELQRIHNMSPQEQRTWYNEMYDALPPERQQKMSEFSKSAGLDRTDLPAAEQKDSQQSQINLFACIAMLFQLFLASEQNQLLYKKFSIAESQIMVQLATYAGQAGVDAAWATFTGAACVAGVGAAFEVGGVGVGINADKDFLKSLKNNSNRHLVEKENMINECRERGTILPSQRPKLNEILKHPLEDGQTLTPAGSADLSEALARNRLQQLDNTTAHEEARIIHEQRQSQARTLSETNHIISPTIDASAHVDASSDEKRSKIDAADSDVESKLANSDKESADSAAETQKGILEAIRVAEAAQQDAIKNY